VVEACFTVVWVDLHYLGEKMADEKLTQQTETTDIAYTDIIYVVKDPSTVPISRKMSIDNFMTEISVKTKLIRGFVSNPQAIYASRAQIVMFRAEAAITITRIHIHGSDTSPTAEMNGDLKFADDVNAGGFANAAVIDVCDTTNGVVTITAGFDDATVPSGKYVYFQMDASPHVDWKDFYIEVYYMVD
jgi:hypothetical protein